MRPLNFIRRNAKVIALAFVLGLIVPWVFGPNLQADVLTDRYELAYDVGGIEKVIVEYHIRMNEITNGYLEQMAKLVETAEASGESEVVVSFPLDLEEGCTDENLSVYCLAVELNKELLAYETVLMKYEGKFDYNAELEGSDLLEDAIESSGRRQNLINDEIVAARAALDLNLAVYNQISLVYPMHMELASLIYNLEEYRDNLAAIRDIVELYPSRFNNATSSTCK